MVNDVIIREATLNEAENVYKILLQGFQQHATHVPDIFLMADDYPKAKEKIVSVINDENAAILIALYKNTIIGAAQFTLVNFETTGVKKDRKYVKIAWFVIDEEYRGQGVGTLLLKEVEAWAREKGVNEVELNVWEFNTEAQNFYKKNNYQPITRIFVKKLQ